MELEEGERAVRVRVRERYNKTEQCVREKDTEREREGVGERERNGELMTKQNEMSTIFGCSEGCLLLISNCKFLCHNCTFSCFQENP